MQDAIGTGPSSLGADVAVGTNAFAVSANTAVSVYTHIVVYAEDS